MPEVTEASAPRLEQASRYCLALDQVGFVRLEGTWSIEKCEYV